MEIPGQIILLLASLTILGKSAHTVVKSLIKITHILSWNRFSVAFIILGIVTSMPEFFVGINSALDKNPQLSLGNVLGATVVLLALVSGATAFFSGRVVFSSWLTKKEFFLMISIILLPILLFYDLVLSRFDALIIICAYSLYLYYVYSSSHKIDHQDQKIETQVEEHKLERSAFFLLMGIIGIFVSSRIAVNSAIFLGNVLKIQVLILGILIFSIGTNLPEIVLTFTGLRDKQRTIAMGNILGSATTNSLVLAVTSLISPIQIKDLETFAVSAFFFVGTVLTFFFIVKSKSDISKSEGAVLLGIYILFVIAEITTNLL